MQFLIDAGLISAPICERIINKRRCSRAMNLQKYTRSVDKYIWRCPRKECKTTKSVSISLSFMEGLRISIGEFLYILAYAFPR